MLNKKTTFLYILSLWNFGITFSIQNIFSNASPFLLSHEITVSELILAVVTLFFIIPSILFIIHITLLRSNIAKKNFLILLGTILLSQGILKIIDIQIKLKPEIYYLIFLILLIILFVLLIKFIHNINFLLFISVIFLAQLVHFFSQTEIPKYININKNMSFNNLNSNGKNINWIVLDELSLSQILVDTNSINSDRFPGFYELSKVTNFYINATSNAGYTDASIPSMLTGKLPDDLKNPKVNFYYPQNLINLLSSEYKINADEAVTNFCLNIGCKSKTSFEISNRYRDFLINDLKILFKVSILPYKYTESKYPKVRTSWGNYEDQEENVNFQKKYLEVNRLQSLEEFIKSDAGKEKYKFNFIHVLFPHNPYEYLPDGSKLEYGKALTMVPGAQDMTLHNKNLNQAYLFQVKYLDKLIGLLALKIKSELKDEIVIVTSDHGVSFQPNPSWRADSLEDVINNVATISSVIRVPLFVHLPNKLDGQKIFKNVQLIDLYPTILEELDITLNSEDIKVDGISLNSDVEHNQIYWYKKDFNFNENQITDGINKILNQNIDYFGKFLGECDLYGTGPFKENICKPTNEFEINKSKLNALFVNYKEVEKINPKINSYNFDFIIYSDDLSKKINSNPDLERWFAISNKNKIVSITKGIIKSSTRENGNAKDLLISGILVNSGQNIYEKDIKLFEVSSLDQLSEIKFSK